MDILDPVDYREKFALTFSFTDRIAAETIVSKTVTATKLSGETAASILSGAATTVGATVVQYITGLAIGETYIVTCEAVTATRELVETFKFTADSL